MVSHEAGHICHLLRRNSLLPGFSLTTLTMHKVPLEYWLGSACQACQDAVMYG